MMSPGPPPQPIYPQNALLSPSSTMAESPRPASITTFSPHQLPPPPSLQYGNTPNAGSESFSGLVLAPLVIPGPDSSAVGALPPQNSGRQQQRPQQLHSPLPQSPHPQQHHQPHVQQLHSPHPLHHPPHPPHPQHPAPPHIPQHPPPPHTLPQHPPPHIAPPTDVRKPTTPGRLLPAQPHSPYPPPTHTPPTHTHTPPYDSSYDLRYGPRHEDHRRSSLSTMVPSPPPFAGQRISPAEDCYPQYQQPQQQQQPENQSFYPSHVNSEENNSIRREPQSSDRSERERYRIHVRQQPVAARACGFGERDRRVIDPPPIVQLIVDNADPTEMRYPFNVVHCTLWSVDGKSDETALTGADKRLTRRLMGTLVSSPFVGQDEEGKEGCFFCFPDLSCRTHGRYRLRFVLMRLKPSDLQPEGYTPIITEALSDVFTVYTAKEFPGMRPSTALTKALKRQGCAISVKKGNEKAVGQAAGSGRDGDEGSGDEGDNSSSTGKTKRRRKT